MKSNGSVLHLFKLVSFSDVLPSPYCQTVVRSSNSDLEIDLLKANLLHHISNHSIFAMFLISVSSFSNFSRSN